MNDTDTMIDSLVGLYYTAYLGMLQTVERLMSREAIVRQYGVGSAAGYARGIADVLEHLGVQDAFLEDVRAAAYIKAEHPEMCHADCGHQHVNYCPCCANHCPDCYIDLGN